MNVVKIKLVEGGQMPEKKTSGAAAYDCYSRIDATVPCFGTMVVPLGFCMEMDSHFYAEVRPRSGLSASGVMCSLGTIDSDYRGEVGAIITNLKPEPFRIRKGDRICQMMFRYLHDTELEQTNFLNETARGSGGFGSTGVSG